MRRQRLHPLPPVPGGSRGGPSRSGSRPLAGRARSLAAALALAAGCTLPPQAGVIPVASSTPQRPYLRYLDGQVSANWTCAVRRGNRLNPRIPPVRINGRPIGFC